jgi:NADH-quinone oxidoreductase subunit C
MSTKLEKLRDALSPLVGERALSLVEALGELTLTVPAAGYRQLVTELRDREDLRFEQLIDLCGIDYSGWAGEAPGPHRFAVVLHLLSVHFNWRLRVRVFVPADDFPVVDSVTSVWPAANWFEREAFDLFGILFDGHDDLRRLLTDYGFIGHPFRKDFPISGNVEMRYDADQRRVIYQPVTIEPREVVPRIVREDTWGNLGPADSSASSAVPPAAPSAGSTR